MTGDELKTVLAEHVKWRGGKGGKCADLRGANLSGAYLIRANLSRANLPHFQIVPEEGAFTGWKKADGCVLKLDIPADAKRTSSLIGRKCRAERVRVIAGWRTDGADMDAGETARSERGGIYAIGETYEPDSYDPDIRVECSHGVHFFMTRLEAEEWK